MAFVERTKDEMKVCLEKWLHGHPFPNLPTIIIDGKDITPTQLLADETLVELMMQLLIDSGRKIDKDPLEFIDKAVTVWKMPALKS